MKHALPTTSHLRIRDGVLSQDLQGEMVVLDLDTGVYWGLNAVGTRAWRLLESGHSLRQVQEALLAEYVVTEEQLNSDLLQLCSTLISKGLVEVVDDAMA